MSNGVMNRCEILTLLWNDTHLSAADVVGAMWILERTADFPVQRLTVFTAAWIAYKTYATCPFERITDFEERVMTMPLLDGMQEEEIRLLQKLHFFIPSVNTHLDAVYEVGKDQDLEDAELDQTIVLSCLMPEMAAEMSKDLFARCVVFAAAYRAEKVVTGLETPEASNEVIFHHGLRLGRQ